MSLDVITLALAKSYTDQHGGGGGGVFTAEGVSYTNKQLADVTNVKGALDELVKKSEHTFYIDLAGDYGNYTCSVAMDDIKAAYNTGYNLVCRCTVSGTMTTLPLFVPMPSTNTWIFSGSGALKSMGFPAQLFTVAITSDGVKALRVGIATEDDRLANPSSLNITVGDTSYTYDGNDTVSIVIGDGTDGITPTIGTNGNWYLGDTDTGKPSRGDKGDKGDPGVKGTDGKTPVKGTDYWTVADKQSIVNDVLAALPTWTGGSY